MGNRFFNIVTLIVIGVIIANMIANASGTSQILNGVGGLWGTSVNGLLGKTSP